jgi:hypothetical protein
MEGKRNVEKQRLKEGGELRYITEEIQKHGK